jgi:hypothetical protein
MDNRRFKVLEKCLVLGYGSHARRPTPTSHIRWAAGSVVELDGEAPDGTVWFLDPDGFRGKIDCGEVANLVRRGVLAELACFNVKESFNEGVSGN